MFFSEVDGIFPNHYAVPTETKNLVDRKDLVARELLDFGAAFDDDGAQVGAIGGGGRVIWGDQLFMIHAGDFLRMVPCAAIIVDASYLNAALNIFH